MQNLAILTNGGDTCALNASIEAIRNEARKVGFGTVYGIEGGYHGLLYGKSRIIAQPVDHRSGGSTLRSLRESPCKLENGQYVVDTDKVRKMVEYLQELEVDVLVVIGGDGTLQATKLFHQAVQDRYRFKIMGFPKTIDNDIRTRTSFAGFEVALCPGFPTAALKISKITEDIRTTAISGQRVFGIETMGRDAGWLVAASAMGGPDMIVIPEVPLDREMMKRLVSRTERRFRLSKNVVIAISEGARMVNENGEIVQVSQQAFGPRKLGGVADRIVKYIEEELRGKFDEENPLEVRPHHTDYAPRAGAPIEYDLKLIQVLAERLRLLLEKEDYGKVPVMKNVVPYEELDVAHAKALKIEDMEKIQFPEREYYNRDRFTTNAKFSRFLRTITSGPERE